jgi:hypothetical protein
MDTPRHMSRLWLLIVLLLTALTLLALPITIGAAGVADLPPREETPTPNHLPAGAYIDLTVTGASIDAWTIVQWQDGNGAWHNIEGWRAALVDDYQQWWLGRNSYGTGPFRWCVLDAPMGSIVASSDAFYMPARSGEWTHVTVTVPAAQ